jgi:hypothetical protein
MATSSNNLDPAAQVEPAMSLQTDKAKATAAEIVADNAALEENLQVAEARAEATTEQASQLADVTEDVVSELQEIKEGAAPA